MNQIKLILADSDSRELDFMVKGFESSEHYEIIAQFSDGGELMAFLDDGRKLPDLVITDLNTRGKSGIEIARQITLNPNFAFLKVIVLSPGFGDINFDLKQSSRGGSPVFFQKPSSLLEYKSFAIKLYDKILADFIHG